MAYFIMSGATALPTHCSRQRSNPAITLCFGNTAFEHLAFVTDGPPEVAHFTADPHYISSRFHCQC